MKVRGVYTLALSGLLMACVAQAGPIFSGPARISSLGQTLVFDLLAGGDLDSLDTLPVNASDYYLQVISTVWSFDPPPGATGSLDLGGTMAIAGADTGLAFSQTIDMSDETGNVVFSSNAGGPDGLPFQTILADQFLTTGGKLFGNIIPNPGTEDDWAEFFASGSQLTNYLFVELTVQDTNQIPEPTAVLVWAGVGALGFGVHRWRRRSKTA